MPPFALPEIPNAREKSVGEMCVLFPIGENDDIIRVQDMLRGMLGNNNSVQWVLPDDFHITALYMNMGDWNAAADAAAVEIPAFSVMVDGIGIFNTPDGYAIILTVRNSGDITNQQSLLYDLMTQPNYVQASDYSAPENYQPHITIGYAVEPIMPFSITPFSVVVDQIEFSDDMQSPIFVEQLKSDLSPSTGVIVSGGKEKMFPIHIIEKSVHYNENEDLIIPVIGIPFKGPIDGIRDPEGDFFHEGTEVGGAREILAFWDHGKDKSYLASELDMLGLTDAEIKSFGPDLGFGERDIGVAQRGEKTPEGIIYNVIVNRNHRYKRMLEVAARNGLIGGSSGAKSYIYDRSVPGKVDYASVVEMTLSATPWNIEARVLNKAIITTEEDMPPKVVDPKTPIEAAVAETPEVKAKGGISAALIAKSAEIPDPVIDAGAVEMVSVPRAEFDALRAEVSGLRETVEKSIMGLSSDMEEAFPLLADLIAKSLRSEISEQVLKSKLELTVEKSNRTPAPVTPAATTRQTTQTRPQASQSGANYAHNAPMANYPGSN